MCITLLSSYPISALHLSIRAMRFVTLFMSWWLFTVCASNCYSFRQNHSWTLRSTCNNFDYIYFLSHFITFSFSLSLLLRTHRDMPYVALGEGKTILLNVTLSNAGDAAFLPMLHLRYPSNLYFIKVLDAVGARLVANTTLHLPQMFYLLSNLVFCSLVHYWYKP